MAVDLNASRIDPARYRSMLSDLQGNILKGHGREHVLLLQITFSDRAAARLWTGMVGGGWTTSAWEQLMQSKQTWTGKAEPWCANLFLTAAGYRFLGVEEGRWPADERFRAGMAASGPALNDPPPQDWVPPYAPDTQPVHAMLAFGAADRATLDIKLAFVKTTLKNVGTLRAERGQFGHALRRKGGQPTQDKQYVDHLNYIDGRSQPLFFAADVRQEENEGGIDAYDPSAPLSLVLVPDPGSEGFGSYLVYRKLEQRVRDFKVRESLAGATSVAARLGISGDDCKRIGAMVMGRFENGTPLALSDCARDEAPANNFNYDADPQGLKCPVFAHVRKMNPRTQASRRHRIVRRGVNFEDVARRKHPSEPHTLDELPESGVGLLFMCFQSAIAEQFEHLQRVANHHDHPLPATGLDPLLAQGDGAHAAELHWPATWGGAEKKPEPFGSFVRLCEGEYFFAPSRSFFRTLMPAA